MGSGVGSGGRVRGVHPGLGSGVADKVRVRVRVRVGVRAKDIIRARDIRRVEGVGVDRSHDHERPRVERVAVHRARDEAIDGARDDVGGEGTDGEVLEATVEQPEPPAEPDAKGREEEVEERCGRGRVVRT